MTNFDFSCESAVTVPLLSLHVPTLLHPLKVISFVDVPPHLLVFSGRREDCVGQEVRHGRVGFVWLASHRSRRRIVAWVVEFMGAGPICLWPQGVRRGRERDVRGGCGEGKAKVTPALD